jgi:hypothetical protein
MADHEMGWSFCIRPHLERELWKSSLPAVSTGPIRAGENPATRHLDQSHVMRTESPQWKDLLFASSRPKTR